MEFLSSLHPLKRPKSSGAWPLEQRDHHERRHECHGQGHGVAFLLGALPKLCIECAATERRDDLFSAEVVRALAKEHSAPGGRFLVPRQGEDPISLRLFHVLSLLFSYVFFRFSI